MLAARFPGDRRITIVETPVPERAPGDVMLRVLRTALCGSDAKLWLKGAQWTPGHEILGVVDEPSHALHGRRCLVYIPVHCGRCASCAAGDTHLCLEGSELVGWNRPGGYAQWVPVPERCLWPVPDDVPDDLAPLLLDTIGTSGHGIRMARPLAPRGPVLVLGAGPVGLGAILALQDAGYQDLRVSDPRLERLALAERFGARAHPMDDRSAHFPLIVESSGAHAARNRALDVVAPKGVVLLLGENDAPWVFEETKRVRRKDFFMLRSFYFPKSDFDANLELLRRRTDCYRALVDGRFGLAELPEAFARFAEGRLVKPLLAPWDS
jgi:threonine dehydrogenase-like Zn-dependent dehydrogenase